MRYALTVIPHFYLNSSVGNHSTFAEKVIDYHFNLTADWDIPSEVEIIYPFDGEEVKEVFSKFYKKFFSDQESRYYLFGINPGRFGAGVTGIPFTDPVILENECMISNKFKKKNELSALFVYDFINNLGGAEAFYSNIYITSICPLGFIKNNKNYNYYDDKMLYKSLEKRIIENIKVQIDFGCKTDRAFCMGKGKNFQYMNMLNKEHQFFEKIIALPHPRWVMQYRLKSKQEHLDFYVNKLSSALK